ncbi:MAG: PD-(D/E)XK nuclease family protein [Betaproteobacteria bacterium]|nr:PD-(D/E)XK nuclease family protein [Betaproteobacteria bacterium]
MLEPHLLAVLAAGHTVVTPNNRLARRLAALHDVAAREGGARTWAAAVAMPWSAWLDSLWREALTAGAVGESSRLLPPATASHLWRRVVEAEAHSRTPLMDTGAAASLALEAWNLLHAWGSGGASWRAWSQAADAAADNDPAAFARWAERYRARLNALGAIDHAGFPEVLLRTAASMPAWRDRNVVLAGFLEFAPQQTRLIAALIAVGMRITACDSVVPSEIRPRSAEGATPRDEVRMALSWARERALAQPGTTIGIAIEDLAQRRGEVRALAEDLLCPALQWPGRAADLRPYSISLGSPLASVPVVAMALDLLALAAGPLPMHDVALLLRSPYLPEKQRWADRASVERVWLDEGRRTVGWHEALAALQSVDSALAHAWRAVRTFVPAQHASSPREWVGAWRAWLGAVGWPGDRGVLDSAEHQAINAWEELLEAFAGIAAVEPLMRADDALTVLRSLAATQVFQPQSPTTPIQILGVLEAAGMPFDALWVVGLSADRWPAAPEPNPLLPLTWLRERAAPRATAARELAYTRVLTDVLARGAEEVVFSHPRQRDDYPCMRSTLLADSEGEPTLLGDTPISVAQAIAVAAAPLESISDERAPPIAAGTYVRGGARVVEAQSDCPFRATALFRLDVEPWPSLPEGLDPAERGTLMHETMAAFWRKVDSHAALAGLASDAVADVVAGCSAQARARLPATRWARLPAAVAAGETRRLTGLACRWIEEYERPRPPFVVSRVETRAHVTLAGLSLRFTLDRVDTLADGTSAIIDYKTGHVIPEAKWFDARPRAPQLGLYALALLAEAPHEAIRTVAFAQIQPGEMRVHGIAANPATWPGLSSVSDVAWFASWLQVETWWHEALGALVGELRAGIATVTPRDNGEPCRRCELQPLCRIRSAPGLSNDEVSDA